MSPLAHPILVFIMRSRHGHDSVGKFLVHCSPRVLPPSPHVLPSRHPLYVPCAWITHSPCYHSVCSRPTQGTPTHMSPELFMSGHVSKASDVYALGILLHELISGHRAYQGVPIPLLPHEVAVKGLRPKWPTGLPEEYRDLQSLAEACWAPQPQDRWGTQRGCTRQQA